MTTMRTLILILFGAALVAPVQADSCTDYRIASAAQSAAKDLTSRLDIKDLAQGSSEAGALVNSLTEWSIRVGEAKRSVLANLNDGAAVTAVESLVALHVAAQQAFNAVGVWTNGSQSRVGNPVIVKTLAIAIEVGEVIDAMFDEICP